MSRRPSTDWGDASFAILAGLTLVVVLVWGGWVGLAAAAVGMVMGSLFIGRLEDRHRR